MASRKVSLTDSVVYADGVTAKQGVTAERNISIGDNSANDLFLLESGDFLLQEDSASRFLRNVDLGPGD